MAASPFPRVLLAFGYDDRWREVMAAPFMRSAFAAGLLVAIAAGVLGYFVVVRRQAFAAHALAHIGFPGATGAVLLGVDVTIGLLAFCVLGALAIGAFGKRLADSEIATGSILAVATGLGLLFNDLNTKHAGGLTSVLFGNLTTIPTGQLLVFAGFTALLLAVMAVIARPLAFASLNPEMAAARGVPVRVLDAVFLVLLALVTAMAVQVVGTLLLFGLVVTPASAALALTARPALVAVMSIAIGSASVVVGLVVAVVLGLPPSFLIVTVAFTVWVTATVVTGRQRRVSVRAGGGGVDRVVGAAVR